MRCVAHDSVFHGCLRRVNCNSPSPTLGHDHDWDHNPISIPEGKSPERNKLSLNLYRGFRQTWPYRQSDRRCATGTSSTSPSATPMHVYKSNSLSLSSHLLFNLPRPLLHHLLALLLPPKSSQIRERLLLFVLNSFNSSLYEMRWTRRLRWTTQGWCRTLISILGLYIM